MKNTFLASKLFWLSDSKKTKDVMAFISHADWDSATGISTYAIIDFSAENQKFSIRSEISADLKKGGDSSYSLKERKSKRCNCR